MSLLTLVRTAAPSSTTLFVSTAVAPGGFTLPSGYFGGWATVDSSEGGTFARLLSPTAGSGQLGTAFMASTGTNGVIQVFSAPLDAQTIIAGTWITGIAFTQFAAGIYQPQIFIGVMKGNGSGLRGTIFARGNLGAARSTTSSELTAWSNTLSGSAVTTQIGDVLVVEYGVNLTSGSARNVTSSVNGTTTITADGVGTSSAKSFITSPIALIPAPSVVPTTLTVGAAASAAASLSMMPAAILTLSAAATAAATLTTRTGLAITAAAVASADLSIVAATTGTGSPMSVYATKIYLSVGSGLVASGADWVPESGDYLDLTDGKKYLVLENGLTAPGANPGTATAGAVPRSGSVRSLPNRQVQLKMLIKGAVQPNTLTATQDSDNSIWAAWRALEYKLEQARAASGPIGHGTNVILMVRFPLSVIQGGESAFTFFDVLDGTISPEDGTNTGTYYTVTLTLSCLPYTRQKAVTWPAVGAYAGPVTNDTASQVYLGPAVNGYTASTVYFTPGSPSAAALGSTLLTGVAAYGSWVQSNTASQYGTAFDGFAAAHAALQVAQVFSHAAWSGAQAIRLGQYVTPLLSAGIIPAGNWTFGLALSASSTSATWTPKVAITQWNTAGHSSTLILDVTTVGATGRTAGGSEVTVFGTVSVPKITLAAGDQLIIETGMSLTGAGGAVTATLYGGGTIVIAADNVAATSAASFMTLPAAITFGYTNATVSGPIAGGAGAMAQVHVLDKSSAGAINRLRIGRRSVPGVQAGSGQGGIQPGDWVGVINSTAAISPATYHTGQSNAVGGDYSSLLIANTNTFTWNDIARFTSQIGGVTPIYEQGIYDVWVRVRDNTAAVDQPDITSLATAALAGSDVLIPDQYAVRVTATTVGGGESDPSAPESITTTYTNLTANNIFYEGFETGDSKSWVTLNNSDTTNGSEEVNTEAALTGQYGFVSSMLTVFGNSQNITTYAAPSQQQIARGFSIPNTTDPIQLGFWFKMVGVGSQRIVIASIASTNLWFNNPPTTTFGGTTNSLNGKMLGNIVNLVIIQDGLYIETWNGGSGPAFTQISGVSVHTMLDQPIWCTMTIASPNFTTGGVSCTATIAAGGISGTATATSIAASGSYVADTVLLGLLIVDGAGMGTVYYDDVFLSQNGSATFPKPTNGLLVGSSDGGAHRNVYVQQGTGPWMQVPSPAQATVLGAGTIFGSGAGGTTPIVEDPPDANPQPCQIRGRLSVAGSSANPIYTPPAPTLLQNSQWHMVNLGTIPLPPLSTMEGLNPSGGSGDGGFSWQLDMQGLSPNAGALGNNTLDVDALWLFPHDEPQVVAEFSGMNNTTPQEWVIDTRRDGRTGALLRLASDQTTQTGSANTIGYLRLAPGNQDLLILAERDGGVHDVTNTAFSVQVRYSPQNNFLSDTSTTY